MKIDLSIGRLSYAIGVAVAATCAFNARGLLGDQVGFLVIGGCGLVIAALTLLRIASLERNWAGAVAAASAVGLIFYALPTLLLAPLAALLAPTAKPGEGVFDREEAAS